MKLVFIAMIALSISMAQADEKIKMYYNNEDLTKIVEVYSKASGQKFIVDPGVRGKITIFNQELVTIDEAFNQLSSALAMNGYAISKQGDTMLIKTARNIQRDLHEVSTERPTLKPERIATWIYSVKNINADSLVRDLRIIASKDGEISSYSSTNQLIMSDWTSNINRVAEVLKEIDKPLDPSTAKLVETTKKDREARKKEHASKKEYKSEKTEK